MLEKRTAYFEIPF